MNQKVLYLDNASTTYMHPDVISYMEHIMHEYYANASSVHTLGLKSQKLLKESRDYLLSTLSPMESGNIYFTSGGSESDNMALKGIADVASGKHIITTKIEHNAVLRTCQYLEKKGYEVTYLDVDSEGLVDLKQLEASIRPDTFLISVMYANNEIGTVQPIRKIGEIAGKHGILFHTDAVQVYGQIPIDVDADHIDLLSVSSHKFRGPKGVGFLYVRNGIQMESLIHGGGQESGMRAGTENVPGIAAMKEAARITFSSLKESVRDLTALRNYFIDKVLKEIPCARLNGSLSHRLPNNINLSFVGIAAGQLLDYLDGHGICVSTGSACSSGSGKPSHVLEAIHLNEDEITGSIRFTINTAVTKEDLDFVIETLKNGIGSLL